MKLILIPVTAIALIASPVFAQAPSTTTTKDSSAAQLGPATKSPATTDTAPMRTRNASGEKDVLQKLLAGATSRADYAPILEKAGYRISSINSDKPEYLEYEVVKGQESYEVQLDFDDKAPVATEIDVTTNMWRADSTKKMMADPNFKTTAMTADAQSQYSDRRFMKSWTDEKEKLEQAMKPGQSVDAYKKQIVDMGYKITSVNDREKDYVEYEIVRGDNSYEVQIDLDEKTQMGREIDVTTNVWEAESTERAKGKK